MDVAEILSAAARMAATCAPERRLVYGFRVVETVLARASASAAEVTVRASSDGSRRLLRWAEHADGRSLGWRLCAVDEWTRQAGGRRRRCSHATPACELPALEQAEAMDAACALLRAALEGHGDRVD